MTCRGRVTNGVVVPEEGAVLPEGAEVRIDVAAEPAEREAAPVDANGDAVQPGSMYERYKHLIGAVKDLPPDASERVDEILYGAPRL